MNNTHYYLKMNWEENPRELETLNDVRNHLVQDCVDIMFQNLERNKELENKRLWARIIDEIGICTEDRLLEICEDMGHKFYKQNPLTERLNKAFFDGELPFCEEIEKIFKEQEERFEKDDCGTMVHTALINSMWKLQRASQVHDWDGFEDEIYRSVQNQLMKYLGLTDEDIKKVREI